MSGIALNEDCNHFAYTRAGTRIDEAALTAWVDQYAGTQVRELLLNPNAMLAAYDSRVTEPYWARYDPDGPDDQPLFASRPPQKRKIDRSWVHAGWQMHRDGLDPYAIWIPRARQVGLEPWLSVRMNDVHEANDEHSYMHSDFWRSRPDLRRVPYRAMERRDRALDYAQAEVREYMLRLIGEMLERYDPEGLELDWMRFGNHFRPGHEAEGAVVLNEFTREVRRLLDSWQQIRGHRIRLGVRVPSRPQCALGLGMDFLTWAREGLLDMLVVTPFWEVCEFDMPMEIWRALLADVDLILAAGLEINVRPDPWTHEQHHSLETARGAAIAMLARGADRIYLFNFMDDPSGREPLLGRDYPAMLRELGEVRTMAGKPRRHVVTFTDTWAVGEPPALPLPRTCRANNWHAFRLPLGPAPEGEVQVRLGLTAGAPEGLEVRLNGALCDFAGEAAADAPRPEFPFFAWQAPAGAALAGYNVIEVVPAAEVTVGWVEVAA